MIRFGLAVSLLAGSAVTAVAQEPELIQKGVISTDRNEAFPAIDPVDGSLWFSVYGKDFDGQALMRAPKQGTGWGAPAPVPFGVSSGDRAPRFSPDGKRLYFTSNRPVNGYPKRDLNIWMAERAGNTWSSPELVPPPVNGQARDMHNVVLNDGTQFLSSYRAGGNSKADIWRVTPKGIMDRIGPPISNDLGQTDLYVSPDGDLMILVVSGGPESLGGDDLYVSRFRNAEWTKPVHLPAPLNSSEYDYGPSVSPDGAWLYFTSHRGGSGDIYRVPMTRVRREVGAALGDPLQVTAKGGGEIVAVFVTGGCCTALEGILQPAIARLRRMLTEQAQKEGVRFRLVGVTNDWEPDSGWAHLKPYGPFDEITVGSNWLSLPFERLAWQDTVMTPSVPQVVIYRHTVKVEQSRIEFGPPEVKLRLRGWKEIQDWGLEQVLVP